MAGAFEQFGGYIAGETLATEITRVNSLDGTVRGFVTEGGFEVVLGGRFFTAKMAVAGTNCEQLVTVLPHRSVYFRELSAELRKC